MNRSLGCMCGRLIWPGDHLVRTMYSPGLDGSPYSTAVELPEALVVHLRSAGRLTFITFGSGSAAFTRPNSPNMEAAEAAINALRSNRVRVMSVSLTYFLRPAAQFSTT